eukprot:UN23583
MDLSRIKKQIQDDFYWDIERDLKADIKLMVENAINYNHADEEICDYARRFWKSTSELLKEAEYNLRLKYHKSQNPTRRKRKRSVTTEEKKQENERKRQKKNEEMIYFKRSSGNNKKRTRKLK